MGADRDIPVRRDERVPPPLARPSIGCRLVGWSLLLGVAFLALSARLAAKEPDWDKPFDKPLYLVHISETSTERGPEKRDVYILHPNQPDDNGILLTSDSYGSQYINKAETAGGPFTTRRQVCDKVKAIPPEKLSLGFDCRQLWALTDCREICKKSLEYGTWDGKNEKPPCTCVCQFGYEILERLEGQFCIPCDQVCPERNEDPHSVFDPSASAPNVCACRCETGYTDEDSDKCVKVECPGRAQSIADLRAASPSFTCPPYRMLNRHCCCEEGAQPWGGVCQKEVDLPPERRQWGRVTAQFVDRVDVLTATLVSKGYTSETLPPATYQPGSYPPGTVVFWVVEGTDKNGKWTRSRYAHVSVVVNKDGDQMEMGAEQVGTFKAGAPPNPPKSTLQNATYTPCEVWLPPKQGTNVKPGVGRLLQMPRGAIPKKSKTETQRWEWTCYGFVKAVAETYVAVPDPGAPLPPQLQQNQAVQTPMKDPPGVPFTLELQQGALYGHGLALDLFLPGGFVEFTDRFLVEVAEDGSSQVYVFDGQANYYSDADGSMTHVPPDRMVSVRDGVASDPRPFDAGSLDRWWKEGTSFEVGGLAIGLGGLAAAGSCLALLAVGCLIVWQVSHRRRSAGPAARARKPAANPRPGQPPPTLAGWGRLSVIQGLAEPAAVRLDRAVLTVGRNSTSDLVLLDGLVSRRHAEIRHEEGQAVLHDLASTNGTFVNGQRVRGFCPLRPGDVISLGHTRLVFQERASGRGQPSPQPHPTAGAPQPSRVSLILDRPVLTIGRASNSDLVLVDSHVSRRHAQIRREQGGIFLYDLGSSNGTFVNSQRVSGAIPLRPGDRIQVGHTELVFRTGTPSQQPLADRGRLVVRRGKASRRSLGLDKPVVTIGRGSESDLVLEDGRVSRRHAEIRQEQGMAILCDLA
jgi:pSer/pThr/pTyr-binding forkhead associated (FHA) protein